MPRAHKLEEFGLVLVGHGSRLPHNKAVIEELKRRVEALGIFKEVRTAYLKWNSPSIKDAIEAITERGINKVVVAPVFLTGGIHTKEDLPKEIRAFANRGDVEIVYVESLGVDDRIVDVILDRIKMAIQSRIGFVGK